MHQTLNKYEYIHIKKKTKKKKEMKRNINYICVFDVSQLNVKVN